MIGTLALVVAGLLTLALLPFYALLAAVLAAALVARVGRRARPRLGDGPPPRLLVVIPAHNEEAMIAATVRSCLASRYDPDRFTVHVIADNCTDRTAEEARAAGASVFERFHDTLRSKGHALENFFEAIEPALPATGDYDAAVLVDADTEVDPDAFAWFADALGRGQDWIQGYYTVTNADASWRTRLMTYAFGLVNGAWMVGLDRLGLGVGLKGNGMCFSRAGLARFPWRAHGLVEDMEFAWMLRLAGERVRFAPDAVVRGEMVSRGGAAAESQRIRWEAGRAALRSRFRGPLLRSDRIGPAGKLAYLVDLQFPPLGTLLVLAMVHLAAAGLAWQLAPAGAAPWSIGFAGAAAFGVGGIGLYLFAPFVVMKLPPRFALALLAAPWFLAWKLVRVAGRRPKAWVRTAREAR